MNTKAGNASPDDRVPDTLPEYRPRIMTGITGRYDVYTPDPDPLDRTFRLRRGFDEPLAADLQGIPAWKRANLPDYFAGQFLAWRKQQKLGLGRGPFEQDFFEKYMNEEIDLYPGQFSCLRSDSPFRCDREEACTMLSIAYSDFDVILGFERERNGGRKAVVVQSAGQVHPGFHGKRNVQEGFRAPGMVELIFDTSPALNTWARDYSIAFRFLDRFHMIPLTAMEQGRYSEFTVFPFSDRKILAARSEFGALHVTAVCGFQSHGPGELVGHVFLWYSIKVPPETDFRLQDFQMRGERV